MFQLYQDDGTKVAEDLRRIAANIAKLPEPLGAEPKPHADALFTKNGEATRAAIML